MQILIIGAGKMGSFFADLLCRNHDVAIYDTDPQRLLFTYMCRRFQSLDEVDMFNPDMVINAVTVKYTLPAFKDILPHVSERCILSDIASVKTGLPGILCRVWASVCLDPIRCLARLLHL